MTFRSAVPDFQLANPIYTGAQVTFFTVDDAGASTGVLATLFADATGSQTLANPQTLDSEGKLAAPVYIDEPVIAEAVGPNVASHRTAAINVRGTWRVDWTTATLYYSTDLLQDPDTLNVYVVVDHYTSGASVAADVTAGHLKVVIDNVTINSPILAAGVWGPFTNFASAATCDIGSSPTVYVNVTGGIDVTSLGSGVNRFRVVKTASPTRFVSGASLNPDTGDFTSFAGQTFFAISDALGVWRFIGAGQNIGTPEHFQAKGDAVSVAGTVSIASGTKNLLVVGAAFTSADVGKAIIVYGAGSAGIAHSSLIDTVTDATHVVLHDNAATTLTASAQQVIYGHDDTQAFLDAATAINAGTIRTFAHTPGKGYLVIPTNAGHAGTAELIALTGVAGLRYDFLGAPLYVGYPDVSRSFNVFSLNACKDVVISGARGTGVSGKEPGGASGVTWLIEQNGCERTRFLEAELTGGKTFYDGFRPIGSGTYNRDTLVTGKCTNVAYGISNRCGTLNLKGDIETDNPLRSLIYYNAEGGKFRIRSKNPTGNDVEIATYGHSTDISNNRTHVSSIEVINTESTTTFHNTVLAQHQADPSVDSIDVDIIIDEISWDVEYPSGGTNQRLLYNQGFTGHQGTEAAGDPGGKIVINIAAGSELRGKNSGSNPIIDLNDTANGYNGTTQTLLTIGGLEIPDLNINPFVLGAGVVTRLKNVRAPNLALPTLQGSHSHWDNVWLGCTFATGGTNAALPLTTPQRVVNPASQAASSTGWMFDFGATALFSDGTSTIGSIYGDTGKFYLTSFGALPIVFRTDSGTERWNMITGGHLKPVTDNAVDIGDATHRPRKIYTVDIDWQVGASRLIGNPTGGATAKSEISLGATLAFVGTALQTIAHTGDVTTPANSFATTITANAVTYAKFQQVATVSLVGNATGAPANATDITLGSTLAFSGSALQTGAGSGDVSWSANSFATAIGANKVTSAMLRTSAGLSVIGRSTNSTGNVADITGTANQVLVVNSAGTAIAFGQVNLTSGAGVTGALPIANGGTGQTTSAAARNASNLNIEGMTTHGDSIYTILSTDRTVATSAAFTASRTWTLPAANTLNAGQSLFVLDLAGGVTASNTLVIARAGADTINSATSVPLSVANGGYLLVSDGTSKWSAQAIGAAIVSGVSSVFGRSGVVVANAGDYSSLTTLAIAGTTDATTTATGSLQSAGGLGVAKSIFGGGLLNISTSVNSSTVGTITNTSATAPQVLTLIASGVTGSTSHFLLIGNDSGGNKVFVYTNGNIQNTNNSYGAISDASAKRPDYVDAPLCLATFRKLRARHYNYLNDNDNEPRRHGFIAQEVEALFPHLVHSNVSPDGQRLKSINYMGFGILAVQAVQELADETDRRIAALQTEIDNLKRAA